MTDEYLPSTNLNVTTDEEDTETSVTSKDEAITTVVHENGYESECSSSSSSRSEEEIACSALEIEADAFTRFIERQRLEVMFELRRLRLGERPVTGQPNRERIETFLNNIHDRQNETGNQSTRPTVPSAHTADIDALINRRCVSGVLSSAAFRQDLESTIRRTITTRPAALPSVQQNSTLPIRQQVLTSATVEQAPSQNVPITPRTPIQQPQPQETSHGPMNVRRQQRELEAWQAITQLQRERIVVEISDLVHRQLVTSALESDFRRHLERNVLNRLEHGAPVQQEQQFIPITVAPPIPPQPARVNSHATPINMETISSRIDEMQKMLQLMFSMQMDMQRTLRQEVAGALSNNPTTIMNFNNQPMSAGHCTICLNAIADTVLYRCGHLCVCYTCGLQLQHATPASAIKCPICRAPVDDILRVYRSSRDGE